MKLFQLPRKAWFLVALVLFIGCEKDDEPSVDPESNTTWKWRKVEGPWDEKYFFSDLKVVDNTIVLDVTEYNNGRSLGDDGFFAFSADLSDVSTSDFERYGIQSSSSTVWVETFLEDVAVLHDESGALVFAGYDELADAAVSCASTIYPSDVGFPDGEFVRDDVGRWAAVNAAGQAIVIVREQSDSGWTDSFVRIENVGLRCNAGASTRQSSVISWEGTIGLSDLEDLPNLYMQAVGDGFIISVEGRFSIEDTSGLFWRSFYVDVTGTVEEIPLRDYECIHTTYFFDGLHYAFTVAFVLNQPGIAESYPTRVLSSTDGGRIWSSVLTGNRFSTGYFGNFFNLEGHHLTYGFETPLTEWTGVSTFKTIEIEPAFWPIKLVVSNGNLFALDHLDLYYIPLAEIPPAQ